MGGGGGGGGGGMMLLIEFQIILFSIGWTSESATTQRRTFAEPTLKGDWRIVWPFFWHQFDHEYFKIDLIEILGCIIVMWFSSYMTFSFIRMQDAVVDGRWLYTNVQVAVGLRAPGFYEQWYSSTPNSPLALQDSKTNTDSRPIPFCEAGHQVLVKFEVVPGYDIPQDSQDCPSSSPSSHHPSWPLFKP
ncbi:hypothetical protein B0H14DRAFT_2583058 [Mycena olivaceomarginata]|nr:hypothetical protein B0H14DRAFT_2583058 [Mycena olivaceomarginata]